MGHDRDKELDEIQAELRGKPTPHIESPENMEIADGSTCFLDQNRACSSDCRAFDISVRPAQGPDVCTILSSITSSASSMEALVNVAGLLKKKNADAQRGTAASAGVPDPTGKKNG